MTDIRLSLLPHTWLIDVDGTIVRHNGHKLEREELLEGVREFWSQIPDADVVVLLSARTQAEMGPTLDFLKQHGCRYDHVLFSLPVGERILVNDSKPGGLNTAMSINVKRDTGLSGFRISLDPEL